MRQRMLLLILLVLPVTVARAQVAEEDSLALVALYNATDGANWANDTNWLTTSVSQWHGVTVTGGRITRLNLANNNLTGEIPAELGTLTNLTELFLKGNGLTGEIPVELGNLTNLDSLDLSRNQLFGNIPAEFGNLTSLIHLFLNNNMLAGILPLSLTKLSRLDVFWFQNTNLCEPVAEDFQAWLQGILNLSSTGCTNVATESSAAVPISFTLLPNYPNPFNSQTTILYGLPQATSVRFVVFDAMGRRVGVLVDAKQLPGWHEVVIDASSLPSGVYFYRLEAGSFQQTGRMLLQK